MAEAQHGSTSVGASRRPGKTRERVRRDTLVLGCFTTCHRFVLCVSAFKYLAMHWHFASAFLSISAHGIWTGSRLVMDPTACCVERRKPTFAPRGPSDGQSCLFDKPLISSRFPGAVGLNRRLECDAISVDFFRAFDPPVEPIPACECDQG